MRRLFTYCIPVDDGTAPNPFWGICTLAICKPVIRRTACVGDWVVAIGSKSARSGDLSGKIVYAMEVSSVMALAGYDAWTTKNLPMKIPDIRSQDPRRRVGDSIYDFSFGEPHQRPGVHLDSNIKTDIDGINVLLSLNFYYFGNRPLALPEHLLPIVHQTQGHKVHANQPYVEAFLAWLQDQGLERNCLVGEPDRLSDVASLLSAFSEVRRRSAQEDAHAPSC